MKDRIISLFHSAKESSIRGYIVVRQDVRKRPLLNFFIALFLLFLLMVANKILTTPAKVEEEKAMRKDVRTFSIGDSPTVTLQGTVDKSGVITISAQTAGVVQKVEVTEGDTVKKGQVLTRLSSNYQGDNAPAVQSAIAYKQYKNTLETFDLQKDLIAKQRDIATASAQNTQELRKITEQSKGDTQSLIDLNNSILTSLNTNLETLKSSGLPDTSEEIIRLKSTIAQLLGGQSQLLQGQRQLNYQTNTTNPPTLLSSLQKEITLKQLDLQEKGLSLSKDISRLQSSLAYIGASLMTPASPVGGVVQKVYVTEGQTVTPGMPVATVVAKNGETTVSVSLPQEVAKTISKAKPSILSLKGKTHEIFPRFVSDEAIEGVLYTAFYTLPSSLQKEATDSESVTISIPLESVSVTTMYVPLDAVYQTADTAYIYIAKNSKAFSQKVRLGKVYGGFVEVLEGIKKGDTIILSRTIFNGDDISTK